MSTTHRRCDFCLHLATHTWHIVEALQSSQSRFEIIEVGGCQNYGPFLGTLNIRCRIITGTQKGTIILTTTQVSADLLALELSTLGKQPTCCPWNRLRWPWRSGRTSLGAGAAGAAALGSGCGLGPWMRCHLAMA